MRTATLLAVALLAVATPTQALQKDGLWHVDFAIEPSLAKPLEPSYPTPPGKTLEPSYPTPPGKTLDPRYPTFLAQKLNTLIDATAVLDPLLGDLGACLRQGAADAAKNIYGIDDTDEEPRYSLCLDKTGDCASIEPGEVDPWVSVGNCQRMAIQIVESLIESEAAWNRIAQIHSAT